MAYIRHEPLRQLRSATIEGTKNGFIDDPTWVKRLLDLLDPELTIIRDAPLSFAQQIVESKLSILRKDPTERELGLILEYGHTIGHAIEWLSHGELIHGEAVGIGMQFAAKFGEHLGITPPEVAECQEQLLGKQLHAPLNIPDNIDRDQIFDTILHDNKRRGGTDIRFIFLDEIGKPHNLDGEFMERIPQNTFKGFLSKY